MTRSPCCSRRSATRLGLAALGTLATARLAPARAEGRIGLDPIQGCCLWGPAFSRYVSGVLLERSSNPAAETTGIRRFDLALGTALNEMASLFQVRPGFGFFDGEYSDNAFAQPEVLLPGTSFGTVSVGRALLRNALYRSADDDLAALTICAHEFAHIAQYRYRCVERLQRGERTKRRLELHADFLAGFYLGRRRFDYRPAQLRNVVQTFMQLGDTNFTEVEHHGTPLERAAALDAGFRMGRARDFQVSEAIDGGYFYLGA